MGKITNSEAFASRVYVSKWINENAMALLNGSIHDFAMLIIALAQLLYGLYYRHGTEQDGDYYVSANSMLKADIGDCKGTAMKVIVLRNSLCHSIGTNMTTERLNEMYNDRGAVEDLLSFLGSLKPVTFSTMTREQKVTYTMIDLGIKEPKYIDVRKCMLLLTDNMYEDADVLESAIKKTLKI